MFADVSRRAPTVPGSLRPDDLRYSFPSSPLAGMLHLVMATITVRVAPRSGRTAVESGPDGVVVRVRAAPEGGRATEEAARALAEILGVPRTRIRLRSGARSRTKTFDVDGLSSQDVQQRLRRG
jgi:uncharacterized protein YggU (UPF0235/DUF167 family)